jgi:hypothetical protein
MEVLIATGILASAMLSLLAVFTAGIKLMAQTRDASAATQVGHEAIERIREGAVPFASTVYDGSVPTPTVAGFPPAPYPTTTVGGQTYTLIVRTQTLPGSTDLVAVDVEVVWQGTHRTHVRTYLYVN